MSVGWLVDELVRRITGRSVGVFFADEVAGPLQLDARIGTPVEVQARVAQVQAISTADLPEPLAGLYELMLDHARTPGTLAARAMLGGNGTSGYDHLEDMVRSEWGLAAEIPSSNGTATARGLAKMYAALSVGGELGGVRLVSAASVERFAQEELHLPDEVMTELTFPGAEVLSGQKVARTLAYQSNSPGLGGTWRFGPSPSAFGAEGLGGQVSFCDPERRVSFAFVRNHCLVADPVGPRLIAALYDCLDLP
jgi:CubicO group peptidase (beta-lactamase class C family)